MLSRAKTEWWKQMRKFKTVSINWNFETQIKTILPQKIRWNTWYVHFGIDLVFEFWSEKRHFFRLFWSETSSAFYIVKCLLLFNYLINFLWVNFGFLNKKNSEVNKHNNFLLENVLQFEVQFFQWFLKKFWKNA